MAYSGGPLDPTAPGQVEKAKLGASRIRALTLALKERLASVFVDPDADPLVIKPAALAPPANSIEIAQLTAAARLGFYKATIYEFIVPGATPAIAPGGYYLAQIATPDSTVNLGQFACIKNTPLFPLSVVDLVIQVYTGGTAIPGSVRLNIIVSNRSTVNNIDISGTTLMAMVFRPT